jgi:protein-disulfide isomerase
MKNKLPFAINATTIMIVLLIVGAFFLGSLYTKVQMLEKNGTPSQLAAQPSAPGGQQAPAAPPQKVDVEVGNFPLLGKKDAKVTVIEFADLRCPFCKQTYETVKPQLTKDYIDTGKVKYAFRNYAFLGPASTLTANATECANEQNKFWEYHDYMYKNQPSESDTSMYTIDKLSEIAGELKMDSNKFKSCLTDNKYDKNVSGDLAAGQAAGVSGTPTFFVNGVPLVGAQPYTAFQTAIDAELAK